ncbi:MAG TPA: 5-carboxymethyl-2-hydroxymuconate Delta-isomerase [Geminicoccaceae bacterium]|nr:5-carboxymethyl-2-hydroxymuconate Delta-isomerase [Geminicoccaceae bacterium]
MPHIIIEYSANLREEIGIDALVEALHRTAIDTGVFPIGGARTRAAERSHYRIADGHPDNGFVHVMLRIGHGRDARTKAGAAERIFDALCAHLAPRFAAGPLGITLEVVEIDPALSFKRNNLHDYVRQRLAQEPR